MTNQLLIKKVTDDLYQIEGSDIKIQFFEDDYQEGRWVALSSDDKIIRTKHLVPVSGKNPKAVAMAVSRIIK